jgi:hypothetical protein
MKQYNLRLEYQLQRSPKMWIVEPNLTLMTERRPLPHLYDSVTQQLCLYQPAYREWEANYLLATHLVPWAVQWLYYFELWTVTGEWHGSGEHPQPGTRPPI